MVKSDGLSGWKVICITAPSFCTFETVAPLPGAESVIGLFPYTCN